MRLLVLSAALAGCGSSPPTSPDAPAPSDAPLDAPAGCDWAQQDHTNAEEVISIMYRGIPTTLCGQLDLAHAPSPDGHDASYKQLALDSAVDQDVVVRIDTAQSIDGYARTSLGLYGRNGTILVGRHGVFAGAVGAGNREYLDLAADYPTSVTAPIPYRITIAPLDRATTCPTVASPIYTEAHDGADSAGNDTVRLTATAVMPTASPSDAPEPTGLVIARGTAARIHGTSAAVAADASGLHDVDTFAITTGPDTDELAIRHAWTGTAPLLSMLASPDLRLFELGNLQATAGPIVELRAVAPSTTYWLWVGGVATSGTDGLPVDYDLSVCGDRE